MAGLNMPCKFDAEHGTFTNGIALRQHYDAEHHDEYRPDPKNSRRVTCSVCRVSMSVGTFYSHRSKAHGGDHAVTYRDDGGRSATASAHPGGVTRSSGYDGLAPGFCTKCGEHTQRKNIAAHLRARHQITVQWGKGGVYWSAEPPVIAAVALPAVLTHPEPQRPSQGHTAPVMNTAGHLSADDIVIPVIEGMAAPGKMVPVVHLAALFAWRDATTAMLEAVKK